MPRGARGGSNPWPEWRLAPCGTLAAVRRHHRRREPLDAACRQAACRDAAERRNPASAGTASLDRREIRNGLPEFVPYVYRGLGYDQITGDMP